MLRFVKRYTYIFIAIFILCQLSLPTQAVDRLRSVSIGALSPSWLGLAHVKQGILSLGPCWPVCSSLEKKQLEELKLENHQLRYQIELLKAQVDLEKLVGQEAELLKQFVQEDGYAQRRKDETFRLIDLYSPSIIGKVIFRETASWNSSFWINVGEKTNQNLRKTVIAKNSPVVVGTSLLGVVEYVGSDRSRVRLITDASLVPSVRVLRGGEQTKVIAEQTRKLLELLRDCEHIGSDHPIKKALKEFFQNLNPSPRNFYLAKGELRGMKSPLFRSRQALLQGVGFHYDVADEEGPARDLKSGQPINDQTQKIPLVQKGDILITTGMDGVFPAGLRTGLVTKVFPLREGATSYELEALSLIENFDDITYVTILPPLQEA